ncbi:MAG: hypothetical protein Q8O13_09915 [Candidatus Omnitrophota bacterium]|nr:hypothetical protein [Candidatus Omnitrophota bacterium]
MFIIIFIIGIAFLALAGLTFLNPQLMIKLVNRLEMKWSVDRELFLNSKVVRTSIGLIFLLAAIVLFYAGYSMIR